MSNVSETSFYGRQARLISWSRPTVSIGSLDVPYDITTFISTAVERGVDFVPISRMAGLKPLGGGATAHVAQTIINLESSFALKHIQFPDSDHPKETDIIRVATVELMVLTHPEVKKHPNILALEGATWDFSDSSRPVRPVLVTEKSTLGDLGTFFSKSGHEVAPENRVEICADIINAVACLHANGTLVKGYLRVAAADDSFRHYPWGYQARKYTHVSRSQRRVLRQAMWLWLLCSICQ